MVLCDVYFGTRRPPARRVQVKIQVAHLRAAFFQMNSLRAWGSLSLLILQSDLNISPFRLEMLLDFSKETRNTSVVMSLILLGVFKV